jgi:hypothetical protein
MKYLLPVLALSLRAQVEALVPGVCLTPARLSLWVLFTRLLFVSPLFVTHYVTVRLPLGV